MFLVPLYGAQTVIAVLHLPYVPCAPVLCPNCHCCAPSTICSLCPCMVSKLSLMCSIYHMFLVPLYGVQTDIAVLHLPYVPCAPVWCPNCHCCAPSTICSSCPCMVSNLSLLCSIYHMFLVPLYGAQTVIAVLHLPYVPCAPCMVPKLSLLCSIYHMFLVPLYGAQTVIAVLHLPYVPCAPVWCPNCHCCAPSTICSLCPCMVSKLSLLCSIYHMFLVPLYGVQTVIDVLHLPYVPCAPVWCPNCHCCAPSTICSLCPCMVPKLSLLCSIYHMFLVPLVWCPNCHCCAPSTICSLCPCMVSNCHCCAPSTICSLYPVWCPNCHCCAPSTICSLCPLYGAQTVITVLHLPYVPCAPVWCPNCHCCAPSTICSLCPCMVSKLSLLFSIYHMFLVPLSLCPCMVSKHSLLCSIYHLFLVPLVWCPNCHSCAPSTICSLCPLYGAQTVIAVLHLPYVPCAPVWCPNCHCCAPSTICSLCPCMVPKLALLCSIYHMFLVPLVWCQTVIALLHLPYVPCAPVWCPNCHCCAPSTICSLCPCMVSKLSLLCSIYHMFLVPLVWCPNCHCCAPSTICSLCPCMVSKLSLLCSIYHMFLVPLVWCPNCQCCAPSTICPLCPCMVPKLSLLCSIYHMFLVPLYGAQTVIAVLHLPYVPCAPVWCPNCHCCAPSTICSLCPCMVPKLSLLCSIYHMFLVPLYGVQTVIAVLHLPSVPCPLVWCPNCHSCAPSTICSLSPCMLPKLS